MNRKTPLILLLMILLFSSVAAMAIPRGARDSGAYHASGMTDMHRYTCLGQPEHLHRDGVCPYSRESANGRTASAGRNSASSVLHGGVSGDSVMMLQKRLIRLGYLSGKANGVYGPATEKAVRDFQTRNGLTADGVAGSHTLRTLYGSGVVRA